jgi:DNA-binding Lrp family transcriptional regulator
MPKSSKDQTEQDEIKVLDALEQHSKNSVDEIAKICGFSRQKVSRIIKNLERNKVIWGYPPVIDESAKNLKHYIVLAKRTLAPFDDNFRKEVINQKIDQIPPGLVKIESIYTTNGIYDFVFILYAPNIMAAKKFVELSFSRGSKYFKEYSILETLIPIRKQGIKNPQIKQLAEYL